jgi:CMP-N-acetylneuraminic acid synthetase
MHTESKILIIIPARGGSKGIPRKNLRLLNGRPLISYSIKTALASKHHPMVVVTSDDQEILTVAAKCGARTHLRHPDLSGDGVTLDPVVYELQEQLSDADIVVTLQPTSPLLRPETLDSAIDRLIADDGVDTIISVIEDTHLTWRKDGERYVPNYAKGSTGSIFRRRSRRPAVL